MNYSALLLSVSVTVLLISFAYSDNRCSLTRANRSTLRGALQFCRKRDYVKKFRFESRFNRCVKVNVCPGATFGRLVFDTKQDCNRVCKQSDDPCARTRCGKTAQCEVGKSGVAVCIPNGRCKPGQPQAKCFIDPCNRRLVANDCPGAARCVSSYCGGCKAHYYDENLNELRKGSRQCAAKKQKENPLEKCSPKPESGPCRAAFTRFYYDRVMGECKTFTYGGCKGNGNNFETLQDCQATCGAVDRCPLPGMAPLPSGCTYKESRPAPYYCPVFTMDCPTTSDLERCSLIQESGPCEAAIPSFYFDRTIQECRPFNYGGCEGNENRFSTMEECQSTCANKFPRCPLPGMARPPPGCSYNETRNPPSFCPGFVLHCPEPDEGTLEQCSQPRETGPCRGSFLRYGYDRTRGQCVEFTYGGCGGNENRFSTMAECESACGNIPQCPVPMLLPMDPACTHDLTPKAPSYCPSYDVICPEGPRSCANVQCPQGSLCRDGRCLPGHSCPVFRLAPVPLGCVRRFVKDSFGCDIPSLYCTGGPCADPSVCSNPCDRCIVAPRSASGFNCAGNSTCESSNPCQTMLCTADSVCKVVFGQGQCVKLPTGQDPSCAAVSCPRGMPCRNGQCQPPCPLPRLTPEPEGCEYRYITNSRGCREAYLHCTGGVCADPRSCPNSCDRCVNTPVLSQPFRCDRNSTCETGPNDCSRMNCPPNSVCKNEFGMGRCVRACPAKPTNPPQDCSWHEFPGPNGCPEYVMACA